MTFINNNYNNNNSRDGEIEDDLIDNAILGTIFMLLQESREEAKPRQSRGIGSDEGHRRLQLLLSCGSNDRFKAAFRMSKDTFFSLRDWLVYHTSLKASKHISVEMKLAIFLFITSRPASQRDTTEHYGIGPRVVSE